MFDLTRFLGKSPAFLQKMVKIRQFYLESTRFYRFSVYFLLPLRYAMSRSHKEKKKEKDDE